MFQLHKTRASALSALNVAMQGNAIFDRLNRETKRCLCILPGNSIKAGDAKRPTYTLSTLNRQA